MSRVKAFLIVVFCSIVFSALWSTQVVSYPDYHPVAANDNCFQCHPGFDNRGPLHDLHVGNQQMTNTCLLCHTSTGDNPKTDSSGEDPAHSCNGCHVGPGLRLHHANAGAPPDAFGLVCANCHPGDPTPDPEDTEPPYYLRTDVDVTNPCGTDPGTGGEDFSGDSKGLDNDGDLDYEGDDTDCLPTAIEKSTWGLIKSLYF